MAFESCGGVVTLRNLLWQIPVLIVLSMPLWWAEAVHFLTIQQIVTQVDATSDNSLDMSMVVMQQSTNGYDDLLLHADRMYSKDDRRLIYMENVRASLGDVANLVMIKSGEVVYDTSQEIMTLLNDVEVKSDDYILKTAAMRYMTKYRRVKSAEAVEVRGRDMKINGTSFMYDLNTGGFRIGSRVHFESL